MSVSPMGFIEVKEETAKFRPIFAFDTLLKMQIIGGLIALGVVSLSGRRSVKEGGKRRGPMFNVVFKPHANIITRGGRARKPRRVSQPHLRLNRKSMRAGLAKVFRSKSR